MMITDPIIDEIRAVRDKDAAENDYDLKKIFASIKKRQKASGRKYVQFPPVKDTKK